MKKRIFVLVLLILSFIICFNSNVNAVENDYNYYDSSEVSEYSDSDSGLLEPMDSSDYDVHEVAIGGGGTFYPYEILLFRIFIVVFIIIVLVVFSFIYKKIKLKKSNNYISDFYE